MSKASEDKKTGNAALNTQGGAVDTKAEAEAFFDVESGGVDIGEVVESGEPFVEPQTSEDEETLAKEGDPVKDKSLSFGDATKVMRSGVRVSRLGWSGQSIHLQQPDAMSLNTMPYFILTNVSGGKAPWSPQHEDLLALDWIVVEE